MTMTREVYRFPGYGPIGHRLLAVDVTDPSIHAQSPYQLVRGAMFSAQVTLAELRRQHLVNMRDAIDRELGR